MRWGTAWKIAWREAWASRTKFFFVVLAVAVGVGALTGVRGFSAAFRHMLLKEARTLMAGDLSARQFVLPNAAQQAMLDGLGREGIRYTWLTELVNHGGVGEGAGSAVDLRQGRGPGRVSVLRRTAV